MKTETMLLAEATMRRKAEERAMRGRGYEKVPVRMWRGKQIIDRDHPGEIIGYVWRKEEQS